MSVYTDAVDANTPTYHWQLGEPAGAPVVGDRKGNHPVPLIRDTGVTLGVTGLVENNDGNTAATFDASAAGACYGTSAARPTS